MCDVLDRVERIGVEKGVEIGAEKRNLEVATDLIRAGQKDASFISQISKLSVDAIYKLANSMGAAIA